MSFTEPTAVQQETANALKLRYVPFDRDNGLLIGTKAHTDTQISVDRNGHSTTVSGSRNGRHTRAQASN